MEGVVVFATENSVPKQGKGGSNWTGTYNCYSLGRMEIEAKTQSVSGSQQMPAEIRMQTQSSELGTEPKVCAFQCKFFCPAN